jgi:hypothetical protein
MIGVDTNFKIRSRQDILKEHDDPILHHGLKALNGTKLIFPTRLIGRITKRWNGG